MKNIISMLGAFCVFIAPSFGAYAGDWTSVEVYNDNLKFGPGTTNVPRTFFGTRDPLSGSERIKIECLPTESEYKNLQTFLAGGADVTFKNNLEFDDDTCVDGYADINEFARSGEMNAAIQQLTDRIHQGIALASVLDTRLPVDGKAQRISFDVATVEDEYAFGTAYVAKKGSFDMSLGYARSKEQGLAKASVGFSW